MASALAHSQEAHHKQANVKVDQREQGFQETKQTLFFNRMKIHGHLKADTDLFQMGKRFY